MKLYYTTSVGQDQIQNDPHLSLGGYKSASPIPNDVFGGLFDVITQFLLSKVPESEYIAIILENNGAEDIENLWLWFEYPEKCYSKLLVAAVDLVSDTNGVLTMEHIPNRNSRPLYAEFYEANEIDDAVLLGTIKTGGMLGLWFERQLIDDLAQEVVKEENLYETNSGNIDMVQAITSEKSDSIKLCFLWGAQYYGSPIGGDLI